MDIIVSAYSLVAPLWKKWAVNGHQQPNKELFNVFKSNQFILEYLHVDIIYTIIISIY